MLLAIRESGPIAARQVTVLRLAQGAAFDISGDVALNTAHRTGDGSDHADVAFNSAFIDPEGYNNTPLKAVLDLADIISIETSTGGVFSKVKATLQILKDLIGGGGGSEWTEIDRETVVGGALTFVEFLNKITDTYDTYRLRIVKGQMNGTGGFAFEVGYGGTPTWLGGSSHVDVRNTSGNTYVGEKYTAGPMALSKIGNNNNWALGSDAVIEGLRDASNNPTFKSKGRQVLAVIANSLSYNAASFGAVADVTNQFDHIRVTFITGLTTTIKSGIFILEGKNDTI